MSELFARVWRQTFFEQPSEEPRSRQTRQSFFPACSASLCPHIITGLKHLIIPQKSRFSKTLNQCFPFCLLFFCETSSLKGASKCVLFFTDIGCGEMAGWGGGGSIQHYHYSPFLLSCSSPPSNYISVFVQHCQVEAFRAIKRNVSEHLVCRYGNFYGRSA